MSLNRFVRQLKPIQENKVNYVDRVQTYLTEADTQDATRMEQSICVGYNMLKNKDLSQEDAVKLAEISEEEWGKIKQKIINDLKLTGKGSFPKNTYPASKKWNEYFPQGAKGSTLTPKNSFDILVLTNVI